MLRIAIVDDHPVALHGMRRLLEPVPDIDVVAAVADPAGLPRDADGFLGADLVIMDLYLDGGPALGAISTVAAECPVLVVSGSREPPDVLDAMKVGASGYVSKHAAEQAYEEAIRAVLSGDPTFYLSSELADLIQAALDTGKRKGTAPVLSPREMEVLSYLAEGFTHQQTATRIGISTATVNTYVVRIRDKLELGNKADLVRWWMRNRPHPR